MNQLLTTFTAAPHPYLAEKHAFSSKERDVETGLSYFGARYYSSDLSIWLSVDPLADKYPHQSNYVYCSNNPIKVIDPNGEDEWDLARDGTLTKRENGNPYMKSCTTNYMHFSDVDVGYSFFEFAAENTSVEWAISSSDREARVGTASEELFVRMPGISSEKESYHSHDLRHTGENFISKGDRDAAKYHIKKNVTTGIYMAGERQYYMFEKKTFPNDTFYDYFGSKEPARSNNN